jgi:aryl-alcohol dehydrogenase-like predicted oxidoreductase
METRILHSGDRQLEVSALCLGVMFLGVKLDDQASFEVLDRYYEAGGRFLDTANNYGAWTPELGTDSGASEATVGRWLASRKVADEMVIATKSGAGKLDPTKPLSGVPPTNYEGLAPDRVREELTGSLERLAVDRIGVYYGHVDDRNRDVGEIADTFSALVDEGLITIPGYSNTATWRLALIRDRAQQSGGHPFGAWQQEHSIYWPAPGYPEDTVITPEGIDYAASDPELTIISYSPQQSGQLVRPWMDFGEKYQHPGSHQRLRLVHEIAHDLGATANQVALAWHLAGPRSNVQYQPGHATTAAADLPVRRAAMIPVFGASSVTQLDEALGALDLKLTDEQLDLLDQS